MNYKIKRNGKTIKVVRGNNGQFAKKHTTRQHRGKHEGKHKEKQLHIGKVFIGVLWWLLIATGLTGVCELKEASKKPLTAEPMKAEAETPTGSFESADIPADYVEPDLFDRYFKDKAEEARKVAECESGLNPNATNATDDWGIMQINGKTWVDYFGVTREQLLDKETNIRLASEIYKLAGDWYDWRFSKKCHHLN